MLNLILLVSVIAQALPDTHLQVALRHKVNGVVQAGIYLVTLDCVGGACALTTVGLNECKRYGPIGKEDPSFTPTVERSTTWEGTLKVSDNGKEIIADEAVSDSLG